MKTHHLLASLALVTVSLVASGCGMITTTGGGGGAPKADGGGLAGTMAEAKTFARGASISAPLACNAAGYLKTSIPQGEAYKLDLSVTGPTGACVHVRHLKATGGDGGVSTEFCTDKETSKSFDVVGQEGGSFVEVMENPACKGASIKIDIH